MVSYTYTNKHTQNNYNIIMLDKIMLYVGLHMYEVRLVQICKT